MMALAEKLSYSDRKHEFREGDVLIIWFGEKSRLCVYDGMDEDTGRERFISRLCGEVVEYHGVCTGYDPRKGYIMGMGEQMHLPKDGKDNERIKKILEDIGN